MRFRRREPYRWRKGKWFIADQPKPKKERTWTLKLGLLILGGYSLFMTGNEVYRVGGENGYQKGRLRGYELGLEAGKARVVCPKPWQTTMAAPSIID